MKLMEKIDEVNNNIPIKVKDAITDLLERFESGGIPYDEIVKVSEDTKISIEDLEVAILLDGITDGWLIDEYFDNEIPIEDEVEHNFDDDEDTPRYKSPDDN